MKIKILVIISTIQLILIILLSLKIYKYSEEIISLNRRLDNVIYTLHIVENAIDEKY